jgi:hypothetical protein
MSTGTGVNVSKANLYAVLGNNVGVNVTKANFYAVFSSSLLIAPVWPDFTFSNGVVGVAYSQQFDLSPATPPTTYSVVAGSLPTSLSLTSISGDLGSISGTPTVAGTYTFTLRATNSAGTADKAFTIVISGPVTVAGGAYTFAG